MPKPDPKLVEMLSAYLDAARKGNITDAFLLVRYADEEYDHDYWTGDLPDMLYELGSAILTERIESPAPSR